MRCSSSTPTTTSPRRRGIVRHYKRSARATDLPIVLYNIPQRTAQDMPNDLLSELAQIENIAAVKQANPANLARIDGLSIYAGNDDLLADVLDLGEPGGILVASHVVGEEMRRMVDEPEHRREIDEELGDVYRELAIAPLACSSRPRSRCSDSRWEARDCRTSSSTSPSATPYGALLERHGLLAAAA